MGMRRFHQRMHVHHAPGIRPPRAHDWPLGGGRAAYRRAHPAWRPMPRARATRAPWARKARAIRMRAARARAARFRPTRPPGARHRAFAGPPMRRPGPWIGRPHGPARIPGAGHVGPDAKHRSSAGRPPLAREAVFRRLKAADENRDGKLSKQEAPELLKRQFERIDKNRDGQLDRIELRQAAERLRKHHLAAFAEGRPGAAKRPKAMGKPARPPVRGGAPKTHKPRKPKLSQAKPKPRKIEAELKKPATKKPIDRTLEEKR